jgi:hypothetical protein
MTYSSQAPRTSDSHVRPDGHSIICSSKKNRERGENSEQQNDNIEEKHPARHIDSRGDPLRINYSKIYTVEYNAKVRFIGQIDNKNMERILTGDTGWQQSDFEDTGELVSVIIEEEPDPGESYHSSQFKILNKHGHLPKLTALLIMVMPSGALMSGSSMLLNQNMELYQSSAAMNKVRPAPTGKAVC